MRGTTLVALCLSLVGCGDPHLTKEQGQVFVERVVPELQRVIDLLHATNASAIAIGKPFRSGDVVSTHAAMGGTEWDVRRDGFSFTLVESPSTVRLLSLVAETPQIQRALGDLWRNGETTLVERFQFVHQFGQLEWVNATNPNPTNEYRVAASQIQHLAKALGYQEGSGAVVPSREMGVNFEWRQSSNGPPMGMGGGYVGLYSASTNLDSVNLVVLAYRGKVQAILQRPR